MAKSTWLLICCLYAGCLGFGGGKAGNSPSPPTEEEFNVYEDLASSLTGDNFAMFSIREIFFPSVGESPVCVPITFWLDCASLSPPYNYSFDFLWTEYSSEAFVGQLLLSSAYYGVVLDGFDWVDYCWFFNDADVSVLLNLTVTTTTCNSSSSVIISQLQAITALLKVYASGSGSSISGGNIDDYRAYAVQWNDTENTTSNTIFHRSQNILTAVVAILDVFIFSFSLGICSNLYDVMYDKTKCKKNPWYPLFWAVVILSVVWNVGPAWLVLSLSSPHIKYSLAVMIPVQFILALFMKKYPEFPIPGMKWWSLPSVMWTRLRGEGEKDDGDDSPPPDKNFFWEVCKLKAPAKAIVSFVFQTLAIWSLLVLFTFVVYYGLTVAISLYLHPIETLVKVLFIKAIAICAVFDVALLFSGKSLDYHCSKAALVVNVTLLSQTLAVLSFLPVLAFLAYTIGGIIFSWPSSQLNGLQGVISLIPSAFLLLVGWYSRGTIFPEELPDEKGGSIKGGESSAHHSSLTGAQHSTAVRLEHDIGKLAGRESGSVHLSEHSPLILGKKP